MLRQKHGVIYEKEHENMTDTTNFKLKKPSYADGADIEAINQNADAIDDELKKANDKIATHTSDTCHIQAGEREKWNASGVSTYIHKKTGTVHNLTGSGNNIEFLATADIADGDTWQVNGQVVTAVLSNGEPLTEDTFKKDNWVTGVRLDGSKLNFRSVGGGGCKELYDFPLSIQETEPIPVNTNHIWIENSKQLPVIIDDAVRANKDNYYCAKIDSMNNINESIEHEKKLTDGNKITVGTSKVTGSAYPWNIATQHSFSTKASINADTKMPVIYSKINNIVDMENAYKWGGSKWNMISQKGNYVMFDGYIYGNTGNSLISRSELSPSGLFATSEDGCWYANIWTGSTTRDDLGELVETNIYRRKGDDLTKSRRTFSDDMDDRLSQCDPIQFAAGDIQFSPDSKYLASVYWYYEVNSIGNVTNTRVFNLAVHHFDQNTNRWELCYIDRTKLYHLVGLGIAWSPDGRYILVTHDQGKVSLFKANEKRISRLNTYTVTSNSTHLFSPLWIGDKIVFLSNTTTNYIYCYQFNENDESISFVKSFGNTKIALDRTTKMDYFKDNIICVWENTGSWEHVFYKIDGSARRTVPYVYSGYGSISISNNKKYLYMSWYSPANDWTEVSCHEIRYNSDILSLQIGSCIGWFRCSHDRHQRSLVSF